MVENRKSTNKNYLDIKSIISEGLKYWYLFAISLVIFFGIAVAVIKLAAPIYLVGSTMLLTIPDNSRNVNTSEFLEGFELIQEVKELQNEILVLQSSPLIRNVIKDLNFNVNYYVKDDYIPKEIYFVIREIYKDVPFEVVMNEEHPQPVEVKFYIKIVDSKEFILKIQEKRATIYDYKTDRVVMEKTDLMIDNRFNFGQEISGPHYSFKVLLNTEYENKYQNKDLYFSFNNIYNLTVNYQNSLKVEPANLEATIVNLTFKGNNIEKSVDFLNGLSNEYLQRDLNKKNYLAITTLDYINQQLADISDSLLYTEQELQEFRRRYQVMDIDEKAGRVYRLLEDLEAQRTALVRNLRYYQSLDQYFETHKDSADLLAPSAMGIDDALLNNLIQELANANSEKNSLIRSNQLRSPRLQILNERISDLKNSVSENIKFIINSTQVAVNDLNDDIARSRYEEYKLPQTQRRLVEIERKFNLNDAVYTFLLQKRAEAQIAKASNLPDSEIIEPASYRSRAFPNTKITFTAALFLGLVIPGIFLSLKRIFNNKITEIGEINAITKLPILGSILHNEDKTNNVIFDIPKAPISESFRTIRAKLQFYTQNDTNHVILVTSAFAKEGKSFFSMNIASSLAGYGKKTILVGCDLRKPSAIIKELRTAGLLGMSEFLVNKADLQEIIVKTQIDNLDIIHAGTIPPNPAELIASFKTSVMILKLKEIYDFVILDAPPLNPVADSYHLMQHTDINIFIVRQNFTNKKYFSLTIQEIEDKEIKNKCIVFNDVKPLNVLDSYVYGYKSYSYNEHEKTRSFRNIFKTNRKKKNKNIKNH